MQFYIAIADIGPYRLWLLPAIVKYTRNKGIGNIKLKSIMFTSVLSIGCVNCNYSSMLAILQITSYALGVLIALLFTCQLHESLIKLYFKKISIFQLFS